MSVNEHLPIKLEPRSRHVAVRRHPIPADHGPPDDHLRRIISILRRRKLPFLVVFLLVLGGIALYTWRQTPQFTATADLLVNSRVLNVEAKDNSVLPEATAEDAAVNTEIQILQSNQIADRVIDALSARDPHFAERVTELPRERARAAAFDTVSSRMKVTRPGNTNVLGVSFPVPDPVLAATVANEFARQYILSKGDTRLSAARSADVGLRGELDALRGRVESAEAAVAQYRRDNGLLSADGVTLTEQEQSVYKQQEAAAQTALAEERSRLNTARSQMARGSKGDDVGEALSSPVVSQLRGQRAQVSAKLAELQAKYKPEHPDVVRAKRELADVDAAIQAEIARVMSNLEARVQVARQREGAASSIAGRARGTLAANEAASVKLNELERRAEALRTNYAAMLQRQTMVASQAVVAESDARIISPALPPKAPSSPNRKLNLALGAMLATLLAGGAVWLLHIFDRTIVSSREAEESLGLPHIVNVPSIKSIARAGEKAIPTADFVLDSPLSMIAEAVRSLLLDIEKDGSAARTRVVGLTSARPGEGKSTLAVWLARVAAVSGRRTLLIDGDIRRPSIATTLGLSPTYGLLDVLSGATTLKEALLRDERSGLWVLPALRQAFAPGQMNSEAQLRALMERLDNVFDLVVIDTAPALAAAESRLLMDHVDHALMVVRWNHTHVPAIRAAIKRLVSIGVRPAGVVMTQVNMKAVGAFAYDDVDHEYRSYAHYGA
jgi:capsular exopolysaccharide synthesis family protein